MKDKVLAQKIKKEFNTPVELAQKYYSALLALNDISLAKRELEVLAFTAVRGTISSTSAKDEFIRQFGSSTNTIDNITSVLKKMNLLVKQNGKIKINPMIALDFTNDNYAIQLNLKIKPKDEPSKGVDKQGGIEDV